MLISVKMPTTVGILTFISRINFVLSRAEHGKSFITSGLDYLQRCIAEIFCTRTSVILLPSHPASFAHTFVSGMQSLYFSESQDAIVLQHCH